MNDWAEVACVFLVIAGFTATQLIDLLRDRFNSDIDRLKKENQTLKQMVQDLSSKAEKK